MDSRDNEHTFIFAGMQELCDGTIVEAMVENPYHLSGHEIHGSVVGIVGLGRNGLAIAKRLVPFGISQLLYCDFSHNPLASGLNAEFVSFDELLTRSDYVMCCCSFMQENSKMFNSDAFKKMKKSAVFINTSRGAVVDQDALVDALQNGDIYGAGLDVTTPEPLPVGHPLLTLNDCLVLPHVGGNTVQATSKMADLCAQNILAGLRGEPLLTPVNT